MEKGNEYCFKLKVFWTLLFTSLGFQVTDVTVLFKFDKIFSFFKWNTEGVWLRSCWQCLQNFEKKQQRKALFFYPTCEWQWALWYICIETFFSFCLYQFFKYWNTSQFRTFYMYFEIASNYRSETHGFLPICLHYVVVTPTCKTKSAELCSLNGSVGCVFLAFEISSSSSTTMSSYIFSCFKDGNWFDQISMNLHVRTQLPTNRPLSNDLNFIKW